MDNRVKTSQNVRYLILSIQFGLQSTPINEGLIKADFKPYHDFYSVRISKSPRNLLQLPEK